MFSRRTRFAVTMASSDIEKMPLRINSTGNDD
jgi:hypothetical protein